MKYEFTGRHITVTPALRKHTREHLDKLDRILDSAPMSAHVILDVEKHRQNAEIVLTWRDHTFKSNSSTKDMYDSITKASEKVEKQLFKLKDRFSTRKRTAVSARVSAAAAEPKSAPTQDGPRIVRSRSYRVKPMTPEEAVVQIEGGKEQFVVFRDAETNRTGVLYRRSDGNYGLIEP
ncbi:MAG: ribosome-associated translation inhibitor RaiA [Blastocatellia bacterium]|jgi:putative sigma-54 modulation protein|nr:ribosome-associated translation inhibitor RaiA [Blastocatellia bacterium]